MALELFGNINEDKNESFVAHKENQKKKEKERAKRLQIALMRAGRTPEAKALELMLLNNPTTRNAYVFVNPQNNNLRQEFHGIEYTEFTANANQSIIHGIITISDYNDDGTVKTNKKEDIYMYQPCFEGKGGFVLGPRYKNGLLSKMPYAYKDPRTGYIYVGEIPKREIVTNRQFDFDSQNKNNFASSCQVNFNDNHASLNKIIRIDYGRDPKTGQIRAVNLTNRVEKARLDAYLKKNANLANANSVLDTYIQLAEKQLVKAEKIETAMLESVNRVGMANNLAEKQSASLEQSNSKQTTLAEENAKLINNMLKYGIKPTYASPMNQGPHPGGPHPGPMSPPPASGPGLHR